MTDERSGDLIAQWRQGNEQAAAELFHRYASQLVALARSRLSAKLNRRLDPEDVVMSAYRSFFAGARQGQFEVERGGDLWRLLVTMTLHKLHRQVKRHSRDKRAVARERDATNGSGMSSFEAQLQAREPSPLEAAALADELEMMMAHLEPLQRRMLELRLQGYNLLEIAAATQRTERTVRRVLDLIRDLMDKASSENAPE
jgi:RNA polymerase sigma factor (sigma-70 family)